MKTSIPFLLPAALLLLSSLTGCSDSAVEPEPESTWEGFAELFAKDPLRHSFDFIDGTYGGIIQEDEIRNAGQHIDYNTLIPGAFRVGIQGGEDGIILDLGPDDSIATQFGVTQTVGGGQGFAHLALMSGDQTNLPEADRIFSVDPFEDNDTVASALPRVGHVYILRIRDRHSDLDLIVKIMPVYLEDGERVAFQWVRMR